MADLNQPPLKRAKVEHGSIESHPDQLPEEMWLNVFSYLGQEDLTNVSETSRRFNKLGRDPCLWRQLLLDWSSIRDSSQSVNRLVDRCDRLEKVKLTNKMFDDAANDKTMMSVVLRAKESLRMLTVEPEIMMKNDSVARMSCLSRLEAVDLSGDKVTSTGIDALAKLSQLKELKMPSCEKVTSKDWCRLFQELKNLEVVDVSDCKNGITNGVVKILAENNPKLEHLVLDECEKVSGLNPLADFNKNLKHLSLEGCYQVKDGGIVKIAKQCPGLSFLSLSLCSAVGDAALRALASNCHQLEHLNLLGCTFINQKTIKLVTDSCPDLRYLSVRGILGVTAQFVDQLRKDNPQLEVLHTFTTKNRRNRGEMQETVDLT